MPKNADAEKNNPCLREQNFTYKCLNDNDFDREKCAEYFQNYKNCKNFWVRACRYVQKGFVSSDRRSKRIRPLIPPPEEREQIKKEYLEKYASTL